MAELAFSVGYVSRLMQRPTTEHQQAVKRIIRYVAGTLDHGLYYPRCPGEAHLVGYNDSDHTDDIDTSKSTGGILFFGKCLVSWQSVKQQVVALSSCEAEYIAASTASTQALWLVLLLGDLLGRDTGAVELRVDSKSALALAKNPVFHERSKHIQVRYHFIRGCLEASSEAAWRKGASRRATSTPRTSLRICSPSLLGGSSSLSFAPGSGWSNSPTRRRTRLRERM
jgi:hypothetical protein